MFLLKESEESQEITPSGSTSNVSDTDTDSDSDIDVTPRRELLITPPTGFAASPIPNDGKMSINVVAPPPLPVSPPPTLLSNNGDEYDSDSDRGEEVEVEMGVAELMDSCRSEMVLLHNVQPQGSLNASLIVREDSALTVNSRDDTPLPKEGQTSDITSRDHSREATPCVDIGGNVTPVYDQISQDQSDLNETGDTQPESVIDSLYSGDATLESAASGTQVVDSDSETEASALNRTDEPTSDIVDIGTSEFQIEADKHHILEAAGTSNLDTYTLTDAAIDVVDAAESGNNDTSMCDSNRNNDRVRDLDKYNEEECNLESQKSDSSSDDDSDDDDIKKLEQKYLDLEYAEDNEESDHGKYQDVSDRNSNFSETEEQDHLDSFVESEGDRMIRDNLEKNGSGVISVENNENSDQKVDQNKENENSESESDDEKKRGCRETDTCISEQVDTNDVDVDIERESEESDTPEVREDPSLSGNSPLLPGVSSLATFGLSL